MISRIIDRWITKSKSSLFSSLKLELNSLNIESDITLYLNRLHKKSKNFAIKNSISIFWDTIKYIHLHNNNYNINYKINFIVYTKQGSFIKTDIKKKVAVGEIKKEEPFALALLCAWVNCCIVYHHRIALHAASIIYNDKSTILFIGKNGAGKSTICNLLSSYANFEKIYDDYINIYSITKKVNISHIHDGPLSENTVSAIYPNYIFFINKDTSSETKISSISKKDAFNRIIFASEFPNNENEMKREYRLDTLARLVKQCRCYSLINGRGLKENPVAFTRLLVSLIKK